jgi:hypothetical protein
MSAVSEPTGGNRRIDRIQRPDYLEGIDALSLEDLRARRDECLAEREYLSLLRRLVQGRAEILAAEITARAEGGDEQAAPLVDRLAAILTADEPDPVSRGEAVRVGLPEDELLLARRRVERLVADAEVSDPSGMDDATLAEVVERLGTEERELSTSRRSVIEVLDVLQGELMRRYKDDPTLALR